LDQLSRYPRIRGSYNSPKALDVTRTAYRVTARERNATYRIPAYSFSPPHSGRGSALRHPLVRGDLGPTRDPTITDAALRAFRQFAGWCESEGLDPDTTSLEDVQRFIQEAARRRRRPRLRLQKQPRRPQP
jgi:hypothetical protein